MSQENVEVVRRMYEAFNRGEAAAARELLHPEAELHQPPEAPDTDSYYGRDHFERGFALFTEEFDEPRFEPEEATEIDGCVIIRVRVSGRGRTSGVETANEWFHAWTVRQGKPHRCFVRTTRAAALKAVGLEP